MAHPQQLCYIETLSKHLTDDYVGKRILEIGSYNVNGSIREFFVNSEYIGTDLNQGPGVDFVCDGHLINHDDNTYDLTVSCESFEHNPYWLETFMNMHRMTKMGGLLIFTCATRGRGEHGTRRSSPKSSPGSQAIGWDYYRNLLEKDFNTNLDLNRLFSEHLFITNNKSKDLYFVGRKVGGTRIFAFDKAIFLEQHTRSQSALEIALQMQRPWYGKVFSPISFLLYLPVHLSLVLPDRYFQNFWVPYTKSIEVFKSPLRKLFSSFSN